jgi:hypothetical protein
MGAVSQPPVGMAPDFRLPALNHKTTVQLSSFRGSPPIEAPHLPLVANALLSGTWQS